MLSFLLTVLAVVLLYREFQKSILPKDRKTIVDYVTENSVDRQSLYASIKRLQPTLDDSLRVCELSRNDLLQEGTEDAAWQCWPDNANTIHYKNAGWFSDKILYERIFYGKNEFVVHTQVFDSVSGKRINRVHRAAYDSLIPEKARTDFNQYKTKKSNVLPHLKDKKLRYEYGYVLTFNWLEIPYKVNGISDNIRILSFGESDDKRVTDKLKSIKDSKARRASTSGKTMNDPMEELKNMIGLSSVKRDIESLRNFIIMQTMRKNNGLQTTEVSLHTVFTGNPGTGKTSVARIMASIFHDVGLLPTDKLIETDRSGLVAEYIGQTAIKTNAVIDRAIGGVLFIDEAYTLAHESDSRDFGHEAIATLLKRMEDDRGKFAVILAGYTDNMKAFMKSNPGLESRFPRIIEFPDYTADELVAIYKSIAGSRGYEVSDGGYNAILQRIEGDLKTKNSKFGNGRYVRNLFEKSIQLQANRLACIHNPSTEELNTITEEDILVP